MTLLIFNTNLRLRIDPFYNLTKKIETGFLSELGFFTLIFVEKPGFWEVMTNPERRLL
ncbi:hypothetical protein PL9214290223 [Planktothrix tepida PCC 9214]|uniref:Uncharacterized protein n=1 Tax=Planktothrix tepida PCC 9214 TaxID=671072 RepID=A0A1J1LGC9_9CYAN|nr:hypothetical protein PL9214290223 [Planktothrix tepida PCC 9214]